MDFRKLLRPPRFSLTFLDTCKDCHEEQYTKVHDSVHQIAFDGGNKNAAVCMDCHNPHTQTRLTGKTSGQLTPSARVDIPQICAKCHNGIYDSYKYSVHGNALTEENNKDLPTCIDCHGVHNIQAPTTVSFRTHPSCAPNAIPMQRSWTGTGSPQMCSIPMWRISTAQP